MYELVARQSIGEDVAALLPAELWPHRSAAVWYADPAADAGDTLREVRGLDEARRRPFVQTVHVLKKPGAVQPPVRDSFSRSALAIAVGDGADEAVNRARHAVESLEFVYASQADEQAPHPAPHGSAAR
jgi:hypothetical protein